MSRVSVIIPIYNISDYIDECIGSVCNQNYSNIEIILVDDGSTDDSPKKCDQWACRDDRIKVIHKMNGGLSDARNAGLDMASGDYIYFLDGDDYVAPDLLEKVIPYMDQGYDMVAFQYYFDYPDGTKKPSQGAPQNYCINNEIDRLNFYMYELLQYKIGWEAWNRIFRRDIIQDHKLRYTDTSQIFAEDILFTMCYCAYAKRIRSLSDVLYFYRQRAGTIMAEQRYRLNANRMNELCKVLYEYFQRQRNCKKIIENFSVIDFLLMKNVITRYRNHCNASFRKVRYELLKEICDFEFFRHQMKTLRNHKQMLYPIYSGTDAAVWINVAEYYADGNELLFKIKKKLDYIFAKQINARNPMEREIIAGYKKFTAFNKRIYLIGTEDFGNIGDCKIAESELNFLKDCVGEYAVKEIPASMYWNHIGYLKKYIRAEDIIIMTGGGNFGTEYEFAQKIKENVIRTWPANKKIVFPQTVYYSPDLNGQDKLEKARNIFTKDNKVIIFAREEESFDFIKKQFSCECYKVPDIVLFDREFVDDNIVRDGVLLCLRNDVEKSLSRDDENKICELIESSNLPLKRTDLQLNYNISGKRRREEIQGKLQEFCAAELVITDRLHGMVFAAITGTPCIVFSNYNHKVKGTYEWITYLPYIRYLETVEAAEAAIPELLALKNCQFYNEPLKPYFDELAKVVKGKCY